MRIVIAGGHGKIALLLSRRLADAGHTPVGLIRNPDHSSDLKAAGAEPLVLDLESASVADVTTALEGADVAVFAAGAGPGSTAERKLTVDRDGAILLADAAIAAGVRRVVIVSAIGTDTFDAESADVFQVYSRAKSEADAYVRATDLDWTIVRPGSLTNDAPVGLVTIGETLEMTPITRADVAAVVEELIVTRRGVHSQFEVVGGGTTIREVLAQL